CLLVYGGTVLF
nr:immunoglobulin light chain junction region [Macaca mulatta]